MSLGQKIKDVFSGGEHSAEAEKGDVDRRTPGSFPVEESDTNVQGGVDHSRIGDKPVSAAGPTDTGGTSHESHHHNKLHKKDDPRGDAGSAEQHTVGTHGDGYKDSGSAFTSSKSESNPGYFKDYRHGTQGIYDNSAGQTASHAGHHVSSDHTHQPDPSKVPGTGRTTAGAGGLDPNEFGNDRSGQKTERSQPTDTHFVSTTSTGGHDRSGHKTEDHKDHHKDHHKDSHKAADTYASNSSDIGGHDSHHSTAKTGTAIGTAGALGATASGATGASGASGATGASGTTGATATGTDEPREHNTVYNGKEKSTISGQEPYWGSLPQGAGVYNTVTGHGSGEDTSAQHRSVPKDGVADSFPQQPSSTDHPAHGTGVYNTVTGHGSTEDRTTQRSTEQHRAFPLDGSGSRAGTTSTNLEHARDTTTSHTASTGSATGASNTLGASTLNTQPRDGSKTDSSVAGLQSSEPARKDHHLAEAAGVAGAGGAAYGAHEHYNHGKKDQPEDLNQAPKDHTSHASHHSKHDDKDESKDGKLFGLFHREKHAKDDNKSVGTSQPGKEHTSHTTHHQSKHEEKEKEHHHSKPADKDDSKEGGKFLGLFHREKHPKDDDTKHANTSDTSSYSHRDTSARDTTLPAHGVTESTTTGNSSRPTESTTTHHPGQTTRSSVDPSNTSAQTAQSHTTRDTAALAGLGAGAGIGAGLAAGHGDSKHTSSTTKPLESSQVSSTTFEPQSDATTSSGSYGTSQAHGLGHTTQDTSTPHNVGPVAGAAALAGSHDNNSNKTHFDPLTSSSYTTGSQSTKHDDPVYQHNTSSQMARDAAILAASGAGKSTSTQKSSDRVTPSTTQHSSIVPDIAPSATQGTSTSHSFAPTSTTQHAGSHQPVNLSSSTQHTTSNQPASVSSTSTTDDHKSRDTAALAGAGAIGAAGAGYLASTHARGDDKPTDVTKQSAPGYSTTSSSYTTQPATQHASTTGGVNQDNSYNHLPGGTTSGFATGATQPSNTNRSDPVFGTTATQASGNSVPSAVGQQSTYSSEGGNASQTDPKVYNELPDGTPSGIAQGASGTTGTATALGGKSHADPAHTTHAKDESGNHGPYNVLSSGTPSGVQIENPK